MIAVPSAERAGAARRPAGALALRVTMSDNSDTATDSTQDDTSGQDVSDATSATPPTPSASPASERPPSANRTGPDHSLRNFGIVLFVVSAVLVVGAYFVQGGLH